MKFSLIALITFGLAPAFATKFIDMKLEDRVAKANLIFMATIDRKVCLTPENTVVPAEESCSGPGIKNRVHYEVTNDETLYFRPHLLNKYQTRNAPKKVAFDSGGLTHVHVPKDEFKAEIGSKMIFLLRQDRDGKWAPIHEAFFQSPPGEKTDIVRIIKNRAKSS